MDYELLHEISLIDREVSNLERKKIRRDTINDLNALKTKHMMLKKLIEEKLSNIKNNDDRVKPLTNELDVKNKERKEYEENLYNTSNVKSIDAYQHHMDKLDATIKILEEEMYLLLGNNENLSSEKNELVNEINEISTSYNVMLREYRQYQEELQEKLSSLEKQRGDLMRGVSEDGKKLYEDIKLGNGYGMSEIRGEICTGCNVDVPVSIINQVRDTHKLIKCPNCGRLIYINN